MRDRPTFLFTLVDIVIHGYFPKSLRGRKVIAFKFICTTQNEWKRWEMYIVEEMCLDRREKGEGLIFFQITLSSDPKVIHDPKVIFRWDEKKR